MKLTDKQIKKIDALLGKLDPNGIRSDVAIAKKGGRVAAARRALLRHLSILDKVDAIKSEGQS